MYVSSTGVFLPYLTVDIPEDGPVPLTDTPPKDPPSYGVLKAQSENLVREGFPKRDLIIRPGYIVGPGDTSDRFTYWPVRLARGGEVLVPGKKTDPVQYVDVRDLAEWMVRLIEGDASGTFNVVGPADEADLRAVPRRARPAGRRRRSPTRGSRTTSGSRPTRSASRRRRTAPGSPMRFRG